MHRVVGHVEEEWSLGVLLDEACRLIGFAVGEELALAPGLERRDVVEGSAIAPDVRIEVARRATDRAAADVVIKALLVGPVWFRAKVPLADVARSVAGGLQRLGDGDLVELHPVRVRRAEELAVPESDVLGRVLRGRPVLDMPDVDIVGDADARGVSPGHDRGARRRAHRARGVAVGEAHPLRREAVDVRRLVVPAAVAGDVCPAEIVDEDQDDVRLPRCRADRARAQGGRAARQRKRPRRDAESAQKPAAVDEGLSR